MKTFFLLFCKHEQASKAGTATGKGLERAGKEVGGDVGGALKEEGRGFQAKQQ